MKCAPIPPRDLQAIFAPRDPAASLRASATHFEALGRPFDADFTRGLATAAARDPHLYTEWAEQQAERVERFLGASK